MSLKFLLANKGKGRIDTSNPITEDDLFEVGGSSNGVGVETDPTVPTHVKNITQTDIDNWNSNEGGSYVDHKITVIQISREDLGDIDFNDEDVLKQAIEDWSRNQNIPVADKEFLAIEVIEGEVEQDTQSPSTPTGITTTNITTNSISLTWNTSTDNVGVTRYKVYQNGVHIQTVTSPSITINGLTPETDYTYQIISVDSSGNESNPSVAVDITAERIVDTQSPTRPTGVTPSTVGQDFVNLSWSPSSDNIEVVQYNVYMNGDYHTSTTDTSIEITGLTPSVQYSFYITAEDEEGNESPASSSILVTTESSEPQEDTEPPTMPANLKLDNKTDTTVQMSWEQSTDNVGVTTYRLFINGNYNRSLAPSYSSVIFTNLTPETEYTFGVLARDSAYNESETAEITVTTNPQDVTDPVEDCTLEITSPTEGQEVVEGNSITLTANIECTEEPIETTVTFTITNPTEGEEFTEGDSIEMRGQIIEE